MINLFKSSFSRLSKFLFANSSDVVADSSLNGDIVFANKLFSKKEKENKIKKI